MANIEETSPADDEDGIAIIFFAWLVEIEHVPQAHSILGGDSCVRISPLWLKRQSSTFVLANFDDARLAGIKG